MEHTTFSRTNRIAGAQSWPWSLLLSGVAQLFQADDKPYRGWIVRVAEASGKTVDVVVSS
jgi:hypothetical protein